MDIKAKLTELAEASLRNPSLFLVEIVASNRTGAKILVIIDGDNGVTIDDCTSLSRELSEKLDTMEIEAEHYVLEVSTPGLDQPLKLKRQFRKNKGRSLKVHRKDKTIVQGKLTEVDEVRIIVKEEVREGKMIIEKEVVVPFDNIERAFVMVSFK